MWRTSGDYLLALLPRLQVLKIPFRGPQTTFRRTAAPAEKGSPPPQHILFTFYLLQWAMGNSSSTEADLRKTVADLRKTVADLRKTVADLQAELLAVRAELQRERDARKAAERVIRKLELDLEAEKRKVSEAWAPHLARCISAALEETRQHHRSLLTGRCLP